MKRVMVVGAPGSGKSTVAAELGALTGLPVFHMDKEVHWTPGWVERSKDEKTQRAKAIEAQERWIFEGGHSTTYSNRAARADTVIWLDLPFMLRLWRIFKRRWKYRGGRTRPDLPENCPEKLDWEFLHWIFSTNWSQQRKIGAALGQATHLNIYHLRHPRDVKHFLESIAR